MIELGALNIFYKKNKYPGDRDTICKKREVVKG
jgi:hypothetical protein